MMEYILCKLPEYILCELFCKWLYVTDISALDCALCCRNNFAREHIWRIISESSNHIPLNSSCIRNISVSYWFWILSREVFVNIVHFNDANMVITLIDFDPSVVKKITERLPISKDEKDMKKSFKVLNRVEEVYLGTTYSDLRLKIYNNLAIVFTNLKRLKFERCNITDVELSSILETNRNSLTKLALIKCGDITGINLLPSLFTNIKELEIVYCGLTDNGWNTVVSGLNNMTRLKLHRSNDMDKGKYLSNLSHLTSLDFTVDDTRGSVDYFSELIPQTLHNLTLMITCTETQFKQTHLKQLFAKSFNSLKHLVIKSMFTKTIFPSSLFGSAPVLFTPNLTAFDLSGFKIRLTMPAILQLFSANLSMLNMSGWRFDIANSNSLITMLSNNNLSNLSLLILTDSVNINNDAFLKFLPPTLHIQK
eukprot:gene14426-19359_t